MKQKFSKNPSERIEEIYLVAEDQGLVRESLEYEKSKSDRYPYWDCKTTGRKFRLIEVTDVFEVSEDKKTFDRWSNSTLLSVVMPKTLEDFSSIISMMQKYQEPTKPKMKFSCKSKNK